MSATSRIIYLLYMSVIFNFGCGFMFQDHGTETSGDFSDHNPENITLTRDKPSVPEKELSSLDDSQGIWERPSNDQAKQDQMTGESPGRSNFLDGPSGNLCNKTVKTTFSTTCLTCGLHQYSACPAGTRQVSAESGVPCTYAVQLKHLIVRLTGCQHLCETTTTISECCPGYWGSDCTACPGGAEQPCNDRGVCFDGADENGTCQCQDEFSGFSCELCAPGRYGADCDKECSCVHGMCSDGIHGDGSCDCDSGYTGTLCAEVLSSCEQMKCPRNSRCIRGWWSNNSSCVCDHGYISQGEDCIPLNMCDAKPTPCHHNATCIQTGPGTFSCLCVWGYQGDGFVCVPSDPCQNDNGGCPNDTTICVYQGPGQSSCMCQYGFENYEAGTGCTMIDICQQNESLCHQHANCSTIGPDQYECICDEGFIGDGRECFGNIIQVLEDLHESDRDLENELTYALTLIRNTYHEELQTHGPFTVFIPTDTGFQKGFTQNEITVVTNSERLGKQILRQHIIARQLTTADMNNASTLYTLQGSTAKLYYKKGDLSYKLHDFNGRGRLIRENIVATNGIIHIIDNVLDKPPVISGGPMKSVMEVLRSEPEYSMTVQLLEAAGLDDVIDRDGPWTILVPYNQAWIEQPEGSALFLQSPEGEEKLIPLLKSHIINPPVIDAMGLVNTHRFVTLANTAITVSLSDTGQLQMNGQANVTQTDIPASNGLIHHLDSLLIPEILQPLLPHHCDLVSARLVKGTCGPCHSKLHCGAQGDEPVGRPEAGCRYWVNVGRRNGGYLPLTGCRQMCNRTYTVPRCCEGFYGEDCYPCPGGFQDPCFGRGKCNDGITNDGSCTCDSIYYGTTCEFCSDRNKYGPGCNTTCSCLHGVCDNRVILGKGYCRLNSCYRGYFGINCDRQVKKCSRRLNCHAHAMCIQIPTRKIKEMIKNQEPLPGQISYSRRLLKKRNRWVSYCQCKMGYEGSGTSCIEIDPCQQADRGGCHSQAKCIKTGPGQHKCDCDSGYVGDGSYCYPGTGCSNMMDCHDNARCDSTGPGQFHCVCELGFHGNGTSCVAENICETDNGGCYKTALCTPTGPGEAKCTCTIGLGGDGYSCYGTLLYEINNHPHLTVLYNLIKNIPYDDNLLTDLSDNFTVLAPNDSAIEEFIQSAPDHFFQDEGNLLMLLSYHMLAEAVTAEELHTLYSDHMIYSLADEDNFSINVTTTDQEIYLKDARILESDLPALNGYIHIIDKVLEPYPVTLIPETLEQLLNEKPEFSRFYHYLQYYGVLPAIEDMDGYTLFAPVDSAWEDHHQANMSSQMLLTYLVPEVIMSWKVPNNGLTVYSVLSHSPNHKLTLMKTKTQITVNEAQIVEPNLMTSGGVVHGIDRLLDVDVRHCDTFKEDTAKGECGPCDESLMCPAGYTSYTSPIVLHDNCTYTVRSLLLEERKGCQQLCHRTIQVAECCEGYSGDRCISACEEDNGGCGKDAICTLVNSTVYCHCKPGYTGDGYNCTQLCTEEPCTPVCTPGDPGCTPGCAPGEPGCTPVCLPGDTSCTPTCTPGEDCTPDADQLSVLDMLQVMPQTSVFFTLAEESGVRVNGQSIISLLNVSNPVTVYAPVNSAITENLVTSGDFLLNYIILGELVVLDNSQSHFDTYQSASGDSLTLIQSHEGKQVTYFANNVLVLEHNIACSNGLIHLLDSSFSDPDTAAQQQSSVRSDVGVILGAGLGLIALLLVFYATWRMKRRIYNVNDKMLDSEPAVSPRTSGPDQVRFISKSTKPDVFYSPSPGTTKPSSDWQRDGQSGRSRSQEVDEARSGCFDNPLYSSTDEDQLLFS